MYVTPVIPGFLTRTNQEKDERTAIEGLIHE